MEDPINKKLVGRWQLAYGQRRESGELTPIESIKLHLREDHSLIALAYSQEGGSESPPTPMWKGKGYWVAANNSLTVRVEETDCLTDQTADRLSASIIKHTAILQNAEILGSARMVVEKASKRKAIWIGPLEQ